MSKIQIAARSADIRLYSAYPGGKNMRLTRILASLGLAAAVMAAVPVSAEAYGMMHHRHMMMRHHMMMHHHGMMMRHHHRHMM